MPHQVKYAQGYKDKEIVCHETGTGKTVCACVWLRDGRDSNALVICPKRVINKWSDELKKWQTTATVVSKELFKKMPKKKWSAVVVDEAADFASPLFTKGRSQLSTALYELLKAYDTPVLLLSATPIRSNPYNLHSLLCFKGHYIDWKTWRSKFFTLEYRPFMSRPAYFPVSDWRTKIRPILEKHADIVLLKDCVDVLPPVEEKTVITQSSPFKSTAIEPKTRFVEEHKHEQKGKVEKILEIAKGYRKVLVVAYYVDQIEELKKELSKERLTYAVHGQTKNQESILKEANTVDECFLIVEAQLGVGWDGDSFSCVVFTSMAYGVYYYTQLKGRVRRIHNLHPVVYYYLIGGKADKAVYENIKLGKDFVPSEWKL